MALISAQGRPLAIVSGVRASQVGSHGYGKALAPSGRVVLATRQAINVRAASHLYGRFLTIPGKSLYRAIPRFFWR